MLPEYMSIWRTRLSRRIKAWKWRRRSDGRRQGRTSTVRHPQVIVKRAKTCSRECSNKLTHTRRWSLREVRQRRHIWKRSAGGPTGTGAESRSEYEQELSLLAELTATSPDVATVVVGESHHISMGRRRWVLGAQYVMLPPQPGNWLAEIIAPFNQYDRGS